MTPPGDSPVEPRSTEAFARELDSADALAPLRDRFRIPRLAGGESAVYFCGNSLGLQPVAAAAMVQQELDAWARLAVDAHFTARNPWYSYHERFRESAARIVGALPGEVVMMNGLTVNLHLMLVSFYRPTPERHKVLMEQAAFPSDAYAIQAQLRYHGFDPGDGIVRATARAGESCPRSDDILELLDRRGSEIALVLLGGVNYYTGQAFDMQRIAEAARRAGCVVGYDLAHAAGNVALQMHDWNVDFAVWCSYKYLNSGPGGVGGCFVHERHERSAELPRFAGWWGNDPERRFRMHLEERFSPVAGADGWQLSNPPILALAPLRAALDLFDEAGMPALRRKSERLTAFLEHQISRAAGDRIRQLTPADPTARGCQLSLQVPTRPRELFHVLQAAGIVADFREPDVIRVAPVPLYNSFHDVWRFGQALDSWKKQADP